MSKHYDYPKAKAICEERKPVTASMGMREDWSWTAEDVWRDGKFLIPTDDPEYLIAGISCSHWATPTLMLEMPNGDEIMVECFTDDKKTSDERAVAMGKEFAFATQGVISGPCQALINRLPVEKQTDA